jgi:hypothetical protein
MIHNLKKICAGGLLLAAASGSSAFAQVLEFSTPVDPGGPNPSFSVVNFTNTAGNTALGFTLRLQFDETQVAFGSCDFAASPTVQNTTCGVEGTNVVVVNYGNFTGSALPASIPNVVTINFTGTGSSTLTALAAPQSDCFDNTGTGLGCALTPIAPPPPGPSATISATDGAEPATNGSFTVTLSAAATADTTVTYTVDPASTATSGADYTALSGSVTILSGQTTASIPDTVLDDATAEGSETVVVNLGAGTGYTVGAPGSATVNIADNEDPIGPALTIATPSLSFTTVPGVP